MNLANSASNNNNNEIVVISKWRYINKLFSLFFVASQISETKQTEHCLQYLAKKAGSYRQYIELLRTRSA